MSYDESRLLYIKKAAETVFQWMGPGHSEAVYESAMDVELLLRALEHRCQVPCSLTYKGYPVGTGFIDILVNEKIVVEIKAVAKLTNKDIQQVNKYLAATDLEQGLLIKFGQDLEIVEVER